MSGPQTTDETVGPPRGPLRGVSVVNLGINAPAPVAAARLTELGASVTKVEPPAGDPLHVAAPAWYASVTAGQRVVMLDLKSPGDRATLDGMLDGCDVLLTSHRPSALARLGLAWSALESRFPQLIQVAIVGHRAPRHEVAGHDLTYLAVQGLLSPPELPRTLIADLGGAERAVSTALALLWSRSRDGATRYAEVALEDAAAAFARPLRHGLTKPGGMLGGGLPAYGLYEADGGWVAVAALEPHFSARLLSELGLPESAGRHELAEALRARSPAAWEAWAEERDIPLTAVRDCP